MSLNFAAQPLIGTALRLSFASPIPASIEFLEDCRLRLSKGEFGASRLLDAEVKVPPGHAGQLVDLTTRAYAIALEREVRVHVQQNFLSVEWNRSLVQSVYPRFGAYLMPLARAFLDAFEDLLGQAPATSVANIGYTNLIDLSDGTPLEAYLRPGFFPSNEGWDGDPITFSALWRLDKQTDYRHQVTRIQSDDTSLLSQYVLENVAGRRLSDGEDGLTALATVHDILNDRFLAIITEEAKAKWQIQLG